MPKSSPSTLVDSRWMERTERCRELRERFASAAAILDFYAIVLEFQGRVAKRMTAVPASDQSFRGQVASLANWEDFQELLRITAKTGPQLLANRARQLQQMHEGDFRQIAGEFLSAEAPSYQGQDDFFLRAVMQPLAERLQIQAVFKPEGMTNRCPICQSLPQFAILRPEGEGAARSLGCSFCLREWLFRRLVCPWCGEENKEKLPRFSSEDSQYVYISGCDTCKRYLKVVDMTTEGRAVPLVDEVAASVLDVWAARQGYSKVAPNLMGL